MLAFLAVIRESEIETRNYTLQDDHLFHAFGLRQTTASVFVLVVCELANRRCCRIVVAPRRDSSARGGSTAPATLAEAESNLQNT